MFKLLLLLSGLAALAASASLRTNPEELHLIWATVEDDLKVRQVEAEMEIRNILEPMKILVDDAKEKLVVDIGEAVEFFHRELKEIEDEAHMHGKDITRCVEKVDEELKFVDDSILEEHRGIFDNLAHEAEQQVEIAIEKSRESLGELEVMRGRVDQCRDVACATDLDIEIVTFYERIVKDLDGAIEIANEAALIKLPVDLDRVQLDKEKYGDEIRKLLNEVKVCAGENPQPGPQP